MRKKGVAVPPLQGRPARPAYAPRLASPCLASLRAVGLRGKKSDVFSHPRNSRPKAASYLNPKEIGLCSSETLRCPHRTALMSSLSLSSFGVQSLRRPPSPFPPTIEQIGPWRTTRHCHWAYASEACSPRPPHPNTNRIACPRPTAQKHTLHFLTPLEGD